MSFDTSSGLKGQGHCKLFCSVFVIGYSGIFMHDIKASSDKTRFYDRETRSQLLWSRSWQNCMKILCIFIISRKITVELWYFAQMSFLSMQYTVTLTLRSRLNVKVTVWLRAWLAEQEDRVWFPASPLEFSEIGYLLLPSRDMAEILLKRRKS